MNSTTTIILNNSPYYIQTTSKSGVSVSFKIDGNFQNVSSNFKKENEKTDKKTDNINKK